MADKWLAFNAFLDNSFAYIGIAAILLAAVAGWLAVKSAFAIMRLILGGAAILMLVMAVIVAGQQWTG